MQEHLTPDWRSAVLAELHALDICNCGRKTPQAENHAIDCPRKLTNEIALLIPDADNAEPQPGWFSVKDHAPALTQSCDWLFPVSDLKRERWMLCGESGLTATVPGTATYWRPAQTLPPR